MDELNNEQIMQLLASGVQSTIDEIKLEGHYFADMKVIYCTPRSFKNDAIEYSLNECIVLKKKFPKLICGKDSAIPGTLTPRLILRRL